MSPLGMQSHNPWVEAKPCWIQQKDTHSSMEGVGRRTAMPFHDFSPDPKDLTNIASLANHLKCSQLWITSKAAHIRQGG